jgi:membrane associated rhomboid family serine protease
VLAINLAFGFLYPGISWQGHLGGLVTGIAVAGSVLALRSPARRPYQWAALGLILVVVVGVVVAKYLTVPVYYR